MPRYYFIAAVLLAIPVYGLYGLFALLGGAGTARFLSAAIGLALLFVLGRSFKLLAEAKQKRDNERHE